MRKLLLLAAVLSCLSTVLLPGDAEAARRRRRRRTTQRTEEVEAEDIGVLKNTDVHVVQRILYGPLGRPEFSVGVAIQSFDRYTTGFQGQVGLSLHPRPFVGFELTAGGGYGFGNNHFQEVTFLSEATGGSSGLGTDATAAVLNVTAGALFSPLYGKFSAGGRRVIHYDWYFVVGGGFQLGAPLEAGNALKPGGGPVLGTGLKLYLNRNTALRFDLRDILLIERRSFSQQVTVRSSWWFTVGASFFIGGRG